MRTKRLAITLAALAGVAGIGVATAQTAGTGSVTQTAAGHRIGGDEAPVKLIEFVSYTCPHCADFEKDAEGALKLVFVRSGKVSVEVRHIVRDPVDLTAALLANCGPKEKFFQNHTALMLAHPQWMAKGRAASAAQKQRWASGDYASRRRAIASDLDFYKLMEQRGYKRTQVDACLNDDAAAQALVSQTYKNSQEFEVPGTPSFALNGAMLDQVHSWEALEPKLQAAVKSAK